MQIAKYMRKTSSVIHSAAGAGNAVADRIP